VSEAQLTIQVNDEQARDDARRISATVPPNTLVFQKKDDRYERVSVAGSGKFTVTLAGSEASPGELIAFDAAGRSAHLGGTPQAVKAALSGASDEEAPPAPPPPARVQEEKREKKREKRKRGPKPLVKPEAAPPPLDAEELQPVVEEEEPPPPKPAKKKAVTIEPEIPEDEEDDPTLREIEELQEDEEKVD
jgi:hypothetical protein